MSKPSFWSVDEDEYVDVLCCTLVETMAVLKLVSGETSWAMWMRDAHVLYDILWSYKQ